MLLRMFKDTRYNRQEQMPEWGKERQLLLSQARVGVIGAGGVKSTLLLALAASGVGFIRVIDMDKVELSNLNRQILYRTKDIGKSKAKITAKKLKELNPDIKVEFVVDKVTSKNIEKLLGDTNFIVEGGDSPAGRNLVNTYCLENKKPYTHASAQYNYGYVFSVVPEDKTACFACFFPTDHTREVSTGAVPVSVLATELSGTLGAVEVLKWFLGYRDRMLVNKKLRFSSLLLSEEFSYEEQKRRRNCPVCSKIYRKKSLSI